MEELENLEETLNDSIRESLGARAGRTSRGKKKEPEEEEFSRLEHNLQIFNYFNKLNCLVDALCSTCFFEMILVRLDLVPHLGLS